MRSDVTDLCTLGEDAKFFIKRALALVATDGDDTYGQLSYVAVTNKDFVTSVTMQEREITHKGQKLDTIRLYGFDPGALGNLQIETD